MSKVELLITGSIANVTLNRPEVKNAFDEDVIKELTEIFTKLSKDMNIRIVVLSGAGDMFCAGADINWMRKSVNYTEKENYEDALKGANMYKLINECPHPVIGRIQGGAFGGGVGLIAVCDIVVVADDAKFAISEVKLGIIPAMIAPYLVKKLGETNARRFNLTAELFTAETAKKIGLVHEVVPKENLDGEVNKIISELLKNGPQAVREAKAMIRNVQNTIFEKIPEFAAATISRIRATPEAQEGLKAFLEKRKANYNNAK